MIKVGIQLTLLYFALVAAAGVLMRSMAIMPISGFNYSHILHAHSHLALLGWVYMALFLLIIKIFFRDNERNSIQHRTIFWLTQLSIMGMFVSFMFQGYALLSIGFSTLHILLSYWFAVMIWRQLNRNRVNRKGTPLSQSYMKGSLVFLVVSSIGPWTLAILSANQWNGSDWYDVAIYFYLHFQYNGWFTLGLLGVLLRLLEVRGIAYPERLIRFQLRLYIWSLIPSFLLSVLWMTTNSLWYVIAAIGACLQWAAIIVLLIFLIQIKSSISTHFKGWAGYMLILAFIALFVKATMELGASLPGLSTLVYDSRHIVIGYLHLTLLGFVSFLCLALFLQQGWLGDRRRTEHMGYMLFLIGFFINELVLFIQGLLDWLDVRGLIYVSEWLWVASIGMAIGILLFSLNSRKLS